MLSNLSTRTYVALGQSFILLSVLLFAYLLGLVPDENRVLRSDRAALAEAIASNGSGYIARDDLERLRTTLRLVVDRNDSLLSAAVRRGNGQLAVSVGDHDRHWREREAELSTDAFVKVPIWNEGQRWGRLELRFVPLLGSGPVAFTRDPRVHLLLFVLVAAFLAFRLYLGRVLRHLDPAQAVPPHVRSALDTLAEGLIVVDRKENIVLANASFAAIVGRTADQLLGVRASEIGFLGEDRRPIAATASPWLRALEQGEPQRNVMMDLRDRDGRTRVFIVNCSPVLGTRGEHAGVLISLDDVTELERNKVELRLSKEAAEAANQAKSDFLATMSHEIRTPMNAILGFTDALRRGFDRSVEDRRRYLDTIHTSGEHLLQLINDVLDLSKVEAGHLEIEQLPVPAHALVHDVVTVLNGRAQEKGLTLSLAVDTPLPASISTDPTRLRQIATNLIGNAIKFTDTGGVKVHLGLAETAEGPVYCLRVIDSGIGISPEKLESIFDPFVQADSSVTRRFGGTGLGLAISRRFARLLGGDIVAQSAPGEGTEFVVTLAPGPLEGVERLSPEAALADRVTEEVATNATWAFPASTRVLVVDDGEENRELLRLVLENVGLETVCAADGREAVELATTHRFDAVLLDMQMPVMDGYEAAGRLREAGLGLPVVALTADAMKGFEEKCLAAGCSHFMTKPVDIDALLGLLGELLAGERTEAARATAPQAGTVAPGLAPLIVSTLADAGPEIRATIAKFVDGLPARLAEAREALGNGDAEALARFAHWLKGAGGTVGFGAFTEPAGALETQAKAGVLEGVSVALDEIEGIAARLERPDAGTSGMNPVSRGTAPGARAGPAAPPRDDTPVTCRLPLANPRLRATAERFLARLETRVAELEAAVGARESSRVAELAAWLKGAAATVGFDHFTAPATALEAAANQGDTGVLAAHVADIRDLLRRIELPAAEGAAGAGQGSGPAADTDMTTP